MKCAIEITCVILLIIAFIKVFLEFLDIRRIKHINKIEALNKLNKEALDYFVTVCSKQLTYFGKEKPNCKYLSFLFHADEFYLFSNDCDSNNKHVVKMVLHVKFDGYALIDQCIQKTYTFIIFEKHLAVLCRNMCVYDRYVENLEWEKKITMISTTHYQNRLLRHWFFSFSTIIFL